MPLSALLSGYLAGVSGLAAFLSLPDEVLVRRPTQDAWSAGEVIHHLADAEVVRTHLYRRVLVEDEPRIAQWDRERYCVVLNYSSRPLLHAVGSFTSLRHGNVDLFASLTPQQWLRTALHPELGPLTLRELVLDATTGLEERLAQARRAVNGSP